MSCFVNTGHKRRDRERKRQREDRDRDKPRVSPGRIGVATRRISAKAAARRPDDAAHRGPRDHGGHADLGPGPGCYWVGFLDFNFLGNEGVFH